MDGYAVKVDELGKLIGDLDTAAARMTEANKKLGGGGAFGSLGTAELGKAGVEFEEAWGYGIGRLGDAASEVTERLKAAKAKYEQIEAQFSDELGRYGSAVLGAGEEPVGGGYTGGVPGIGGLGSAGPPGGGYTGGVPGIGEPTGAGSAGGGLAGGGLAGGGSAGGEPADAGSAGGGPGGGGPAGDGPGGVDRSAEPRGSVGGGPAGGITDLLNGLGR
ncbi:hypothetical protein [Amycolatopsis sp. lyj-23]|uniref:hypothetical protein n=1 Tax=Amycolatopsis sp. lyj-23 TaxID=2789283 RepID=UPI0039797C2F